MVIAGLQAAEVGVIQRMGLEHIESIADSKDPARKNTQDRIKDGQYHSFGALTDYLKRLQSLRRRALY